jgi:hypothetical protein
MAEEKAKEVNETEFVFASKLDTILIGAFPETEMAKLVEISKFFMFEGFDLSLFKKWCQFKWGCSASTTVAEALMTKKLQEKLGVPSLVGASRMAVYVTTLCALVLCRGVNMAPGSSNFNRSTVQGKELMTEIFSSLSVEFPKTARNKTTITLGRIIPSWPDAAANLSSRGVGKVLGRVPNGIDPLYCFPGMASIVPKTKIMSYLCWQLSFDQLTAKPAKKGTQDYKDKDYRHKRVIKFWNTSRVGRSDLKLDHAGWEKQGLITKVQHEPMDVAEANEAVEVFKRIGKEVLIRDLVM